MLRIGVAASKMSKGSLLNYNLCVILISCIFSLFMFFVCGLSLLPIVFLISLILHALKPAGVYAGWVHIFNICLVVLGLVVGVFNIVAISKNIQLTKNKI